MVRHIIHVVLAFVIGVPLGFLSAVFSTPLLWRLENTFGVELAGHSGPADWIIITGIFIAVVLVWMVIRLMSRPAR